LTGAADPKDWTLPCSSSREGRIFYARHADDKDEGPSTCLIMRMKEGYVPDRDIIGP
jgi:hypothetical protein